MNMKSREEIMAVINELSFTYKYSVDASQSREATFARVAINALTWVVGMGGPMEESANVAIEDHNKRDWREGKIVDGISCSNCGASPLKGNENNSVLVDVGLTMGQGTGQCHECGHRIEYDVCLIKSKAHGLYEIVPKAMIEMVEE